MKRCVWCPQPITGPFFQLVTGWVTSGKRDSLTLRKDVDPPQFAHPSCLRLRQLGVPEEQGALL